MSKNLIDKFCKIYDENKTNRNINSFIFAWFNDFAEKMNLKEITVIYCNTVIYSCCWRQNLSVYGEVCD